MMADRDVARLERLLEWRRGEEELARLSEASALRAVEAARGRVRLLQEQVRTCRQCAASDATDGEVLTNAQHCAARLNAEAARQQNELEDAMNALTQAREGLAEAGRRRLAVERMVATCVLRQRERERAAAQVDIDDGGRLRLMLEGE
ncbi:MAG: flagellar FliJ family protein [Armatimonadota bacterium]